MNMLIIKGICVVLVFQAVVYVRGASSESDSSNLFKQRKVISSHQHGRVVRSTSNCNSWSTWTNENTPTLVHKNETETITTKMRSDFCPSFGVTDKVECKDNLGEPFVKGYKTADLEVKCNSEGASCNVINKDFHMCPNLYVRFYCDCVSTRPPASTLPTSTEVTSTVKHDETTTMKHDVTSTVNKAPEKTSRPTTASPSNTVNIQSTQQPSSGVHLTSSISKSTATNNPFSPESTTQKGNTVEDSKGTDYVNIGGVQIRWWIIILAASFVMFLLNFILTMCMYHKMRQRLQQGKHMDKRIHPLRDI